MIAAWTSLRSLAYLKRMARAMERIADAQERSVPISQRKPLKLAEIFVANRSAEEVEDEQEVSGLR